MKLFHVFLTSRIVFLSPNTTARFQPLDEGVIAIAKMAYKFGLLRKCTKSLPLMPTSTKINVQTTPGRGNMGLEEGHLPRIADATAIVDSVWNNIDRSSIINCWIKSTCMPSKHQISWQQLGQSLWSATHHQSLQGHENAFKELID